MKINGYIFGLFLFTILVSCNENETPTEPAGTAGALEAGINGNQVVATGANAQAFLFNEVLTVVGIDSTNADEIRLMIGQPEVGFFDLSGNNTLTNGQFTRSGEASFNSTISGGGGMLDITEFDEENALVSGTFEFNGVRPTGEFDEEGNPINDSQFVSEGIFTAIPISFDLPNNPTNSFAALVDGTPFTPTAIVAFETITNGVSTLRIIARDGVSGASLSFSFPIAINGNQNFDIIPDINSVTGQYILSDEADPIFIADGTLLLANSPQLRMATATFNFTALDFTGQDERNFEITEGSFSIVY